MSGARLATILILSTSIDALAATGVLVITLRRESPRRITFGRIALAIIAAGVTFVGKLPLLALAGIDLYGLIHLAYLDLCSALPLAGLAMLIFGRRCLSAWGRLTAMVMLLPAGAGLYASFIEPYRLKLERASVPVPPVAGGSESIRIAVLSDVQTDHVASHERRAFAEAMATNPDIILLPGDLYHGRGADFDRELPAFRALLGTLSAPGGVYFALGDVDWRERQIARALEGTQVQLLENRIVRIEVRGRRITLAGLELEFDSPAAQRTIRDLETEPGRDDIRLLMAHRPDVVLRLGRDSRIDLVVAGHTHGGQVVLPFFGPPITFSDLPRRVAAGGLHNVGGNWLYVSRGIGCERGQAPRIRFLCPPEVSLLTLTSAEASAETTQPK